MPGIPVKVNIKEEKTREREEREERKEKKEIIKGDRIEKFFLFSLIFLLPIFFIPIATNNLQGLSKQFLSEIIIFFLFFLFLFSRIRAKKLSFRFSWFYLPVIFPLFIWGLSNIFAVWPYGSFWGITLDIYDSFLSLLLYSLFLFLFLNIFDSEKDIKKSFHLFFSSLFVAVIISIFYIYGKGILPLRFLVQRNFNPVGKLSSVAILVSLSFPFIISFFNQEKKKILKLYLGILGLVFLFYLFLVNSRVSWLVLMTAMVFIFAFELMNTKKLNIFGLSLPAILLVISLFFIVFRFNIPFLPNPPAEYIITQKVGLHIAKDQLKERFLLGPGPGNFTYSFSRFKPVDLNKSPLWSMRFGSSSEFLNVLTTTGVLGFLAFLFLIFYFLKLSFHHLYSSPFLSWPIIASYIGILAGFLFYPSNFVLSFFFWLLMSANLLLIEINK